MIGIYEGGIWVHAIYIYKVVCKVDATLVCKVEMYLLLTVGMQSGDVFISWASYVNSMVSLYVGIYTSAY